MHTAAVYLGGYGVECMLKALILESVDAKNRAEAQKKFRGRIAHDFDWLRGMYRNLGGAEPPKEIIKQLVIVSGWSTDLRHEPRQIAAPDALAFMKAVEAIIHWADGRL